MNRYQFEVLAFLEKNGKNVYAIRTLSDKLKISGTEVSKALGIKCVIAKSYARIFFRNSINNGLLLIENADLHDAVKEGDTIDVEVNAQITHNGKAYPIASLPDNLVDILNAGGLVKAMRKLNGLD